MFKNSKYDHGDVILSVGAFWYDTLKEWQLHAPCLVVDYEATPELYEKKKPLVSLNGTVLGRVEVYHAAVTDRTGTATLYYYRGGMQGNSVSTAWAPHVLKDEYFEKKISVACVSMTDVLTRFPKVKELWLNCEGSEVPILLNTDLELLARCEYISCEFHRFSSFLNVTNGEIARCVERLRPYFDARCAEDYHPFYEFFRTK